MVLVQTEPPVTLLGQIMCTDPEVGQAVAQVAQVVPGPATVAAVINMVATAQIMVQVPGAVDITLAAHTTMAATAPPVWS
jgi:hypothetical protein